LNVDGQSWRQPLTVAPDPRVSATAQDYKRAFDLARRIEADRVRAHTALAKAKSEALAAVVKRLDDLAQAVDGADGPPTPDAERGYDQASAALAPLLAKP
jgi:sugar phosphate isomerase/epimerase